jgi:DNA-binding IclR family transcriptional regulator
MNLVRETGKQVVPKQVLVLHKTLDILETVKRDGSRMALAEIARSVAMPKATVYRILTTLEVRGYVDRRSDGRYSIAEKLFALQSDMSPAQRLLQVAPSVMQELAAASGETVNLGTLDGGEVVVIATVESPQSVRMASKVGNRRPLHTTALGKALLASLNDDAVRRLLRMKGLPRLTPNSITTQTAMIAEVQRVRRRKYAVDNQENEIEGRCVAMNIGGLENLPAALSISGPVFRMDMRRLRSLLPKLKESCLRIEASLS